LLFISFIVIFAWTFFEPQLMFYVYDELGWTTAQLGVAASGYGVASMLGQTVLGRLSDRFGRKPLLLVGILLHSAQYAGMIFTTSYQLIMLAFIAAGLGEALFSPALSAYYLDITPEQHRSRVMGIKGSAGSLGSLAGPALVVAAIGFISPQGVFIISTSSLFVGALLALIVLRIPRRVAEKTDAVWETSSRRVVAAQASLRGVVLSAATVRKLKDVS
jgi:MFS family permease